MSSNDRELTKGYVSGPEAATQPRRESLTLVAEAERVVLVEGISDRIALDAVAASRGFDPTADGTVIAPMGGAHAIDTFLDLIGPMSATPRPFTVLCDAAELPVIAQAFTRVGHRVEHVRARRWNEAGCFVCDPDLESVLIAAVGAEAVVDMIEVLGDGGALRTLQKQSAWVGRPLEAQLHRFIRAKARRMHHYAGPLVERADLTSSLEPLRHVLGIQ